MIKSVKGGGYCSDSTLTARDKNGHIIESYQKWVNMLTRCYCEKYKSRFPTYEQTHVAKEWLDYKNFKVWFDNYEYKEEGWELDKDLLTGCSTIYSPESCTLVPKDINYLLLDRGKILYTDLPKGVTYHKRVGKYYVQCCLGGGLYYKKYCSTVHEAILSYNKIKSKTIIDRVNKYNGRIDPVLASNLQTLAARMVLTDE